MIFRETRLAGAFVIELEPAQDERGSFARTFCRREFEAHGLRTEVAQSSVSRNQRKGTLRGMHYQADPHLETKLVSCIRGAVYDVLLDLRPASATRGEWVAVGLDALSGRMLYVPGGVAHGFQTLEDDTYIQYQMSEFYHPESARGVRWDDPAFGISWPPTERRILSPRDAGYALVGDSARLLAHSAVEPAATTRRSGCVRQNPGGGEAAVVVRRKGGVRLC